MKFYNRFLFILILFSVSLRCFSQTNVDGLVMEKNNVCFGATYGTSSWTNYWEGTFKRNNLNLGKVQTNNIMMMANYGLCHKINIIATLPYIKTNASAGQLLGQYGFQDMSMFAKINVLETNILKGDFNMYVVPGFSLPISNYTPDILPLSIGLKSKIVSLRLLLDFEYKHWTTTLSGSYSYRNNVMLNRTTYYTTEMHYTNEVRMPNTTNIQLRTGYRSNRIVLEAILDKSNTLGGFDIVKNAMPFVSNRMNTTQLGLNVKYNFPWINGLSAIANGFTTLSGRNVGLASSYNAGVFYIIDFSKNHSKK